MRSRAAGLSLPLGVLLAAACGRTGPEDGRIGGTISGLTGASLALSEQTAGTIAISSGATAFTLPNPVGYDIKYNVSVSSQPTGQICSVANGSGTMGALDIATVTVTCGNTASGPYTLAGNLTSPSVTGLSLYDAAAGTVTPAGGATSFAFPKPLTTGTRYSISIASYPPEQNCSITNGSGQVGTGSTPIITVTCNYYYGLKRWVRGPNTANSYGTYGELGTPSTSAWPGARTNTGQWIDGGGNIWLFGGIGYGASGNMGTLNDLWRFDSTGAWTWMGGTSTLSPSSSYGTQNVASSSNYPGGKHGLKSWRDTNGTVWIFGGDGVDSSGNYGLQNDLWKYDTNNNWTWVSGSKTANSYGTYTASGGSTVGPGARLDGVAWSDSSGTHWLFGGSGYAAPGSTGNLNDLWKWTQSGGWSFVGGSTSANSAGSYGTLGSPSPSNFPGARDTPMLWSDSQGNVWLFGGGWSGASGTTKTIRSDLWKYDAMGIWTWMGGPNTDRQKGIYGTLGTPNGANIPGARCCSGTWKDSAGYFWLFGGEGIDSNGAVGYLNDLWRYDPASGQWTWFGGPNTINSQGSPGVMGAASPTSNPSSRYLPAVMATLH